MAAAVASRPCPTSPSPPSAPTGRASWPPSPGVRRAGLQPRGHVDDHPARPLRHDAGRRHTRGLTPGELERALAGPRAELDLVVAVRALDDDVPVVTAQATRGRSRSTAPTAPASCTGSRASWPSETVNIVDLTTRVIGDPARPRTPCCSRSRCRPALDVDELGGRLTRAGAASSASSAACTRPRPTSCDRGLSGGGAAGAPAPGARAEPARGARSGGSTTWPDRPGRRPRRHHAGVARVRRAGRAADRRGRCGPSSSTSPGTARRARATARSCCSTPRCVAVDAR